MKTLDKRGLIDRPAPRKCLKDDTERICYNKINLILKFTTIIEMFGTAILLKYGGKDKYGYRVTLLK